MLISGGVDSSVVFSLLCKALPEPGRVLGLFVDHGMMRYEEGAMVKVRGDTFLFVGLCLPNLPCAADERRD